MGLKEWILIELAAACLLFGVGYWRGRRRRRAVEENAGEGAVRRWLTKGFTDPQFHLMNNLTVPYEAGTAQIDHVLLATRGIFVIEVKDYNKGTLIVPTEPNAQWRKQLGRYSYPLRNALRQNARHVEAVRTLLDCVEPQHVHSLVVFTGSAQLQPGHPANVMHLPALIPHIQGYPAKVMTLRDLQVCVGQLEWTRKRISRQTDVEHLAYLERRYGPLD
jgi:hypothetical protein